MSTCLQKEVTGCLVTCTSSGSCGGTDIASCVEYAGHPPSEVLACCKFSNCLSSKPSLLVMEGAYPQKQVKAMSHELQVNPY